jgi:hypothetical protein
LSRDDLFIDLVTARFDGGELVYVERRADQYHWVRLLPGAVPPWLVAPFPDAWICWDGAFPAGDLDYARQVFNALLADMEHQPSPAA